MDTLINTLTDRGIVKSRGLTWGILRLNTIINTHLIKAINDCDGISVRVPIRVGVDHEDFTIHWPMEN